MAGDSVVVMLAGLPFAGWKSVKIGVSYEDVSGECTLVISPQPGNPLPTRVGDTAIVLLAGQPVVTGHVHKVSGKHDSKTHDITLTIRDKTQDFIDSTVGPGAEFKPPVKLQEIAQGTLEKMGLSDIQVIDKANPETFRPGGEVPVAQVNDKGFNFVDDWAKKRQVVMHSDGKGNIVIDRNKKERSGGVLFKSFEDNPLNNVLSAQYDNSDFGRHNTTSVAGQKSTNDKDHWEKQPKNDPPAQADPLSRNWGTATDTAVRPQRRLHIRGRQGIEGKTPEDAAKWNANLARARNYTYSATVQGFEALPGQLWWPGKLVTVRDDHFQISDELFIKSVDFSKDWGSGAITSISCTTKDAYSETSEGEPSSRTASPGVGHSEPGTFGAGDTSALGGN
jgi:prophage tail gpP-like protein